MIPLRDSNPARRTPFVTWAIVGTIVAVFFLWQPGPAGEDVADIEFNLRHAAIPCELVQGRSLSLEEVRATFGPAADGEACALGDESPQFDPDKNVWAAVVVSMFLHGGLLHLGGNLLFLWIFGNNVEDRLGHVPYALFYVVAGAAATATHVALNLDSTVPIVGASGAIAGVMGAYMVWYPNAPVRTAVIFLLITVIDVRAKWLLGIWFVLQFMTNPNSGVAWAAHVGGFVFGAIAAFVLGSGPRRVPARA